METVNSRNRLTIVLGAFVAMLVFPSIGLIAALIAQGMEPFDGSCLAAHLHGLAADLWAHVHGQCGLMARELATLLPDAFNHSRHGHDD